MKGQLLRAFTRAKAVRLKDGLSLSQQNREPKLLSKAHSSKRAASSFIDSGLLAKPVPSLVPARSESVLRGQHASRLAAKLKRTEESLHRQSLSFQRFSPKHGRSVVLCSSRNSFPPSFLSLKKQQTHFISLPKVERSEPCVATVNLSCSLPKLHLSTDPLPAPAKPRRKLKSLQSAPGA